MYIMEQLGTVFGSFLVMFISILSVLIAILALFTPIFIYQIRNYVKDIKETQERILARLPKRQI